MVSADRFTLAEAFRELSALLTAVTVAVAADVTVAGALYSPEFEMDPGPETLHVTEVSDGPETDAENCCVPPAAKLEVVGEMEIWFCALMLTVAEA